MKEAPADMTLDTPLLVLGSASPRRRQLLDEVGVPVRVRSVEVDESVRPEESPTDYLERIVVTKLAAVAAAIEDAPAVLVADTVVVLDGVILGKPENTQAARATIGRLQGRTHTVMTRYAVGTAPDIGEVRVARTVETSVTMRPASEEEVARYAATGEGLDKAGAYAIQGVGAFLVQSIHGSYSNVVGLPVCEVIVDLQALGVLGSFP